MRRAQTAPTPAVGRASVSTEGQEVTFALSTLTLLMVCSVSKDKTCKEKTGKKIEIHYRHCPGKTDAGRVGTPQEDRPETAQFEWKRESHGTRS